MFNETAIIDSIIKGNSSDFVLLVEKYEYIVSSFIYNMTMDKAATEVITQDTFIYAYRKLYTFKRKNKFSNWLLIIAKNKAGDYIRKNKICVIIDENVFSSIIDNNISPEESAEINDFINQLNDIERNILSLKYISDDITFYDIAIILNISDQSARKRFHRIKYKLKNFCMKGENADEVQEL